MPKYSCGLCVDNAANYSLEILTDYDTTGVVHVCWPCLQTRIGDLMHDLVPDRNPHVDGDRLGGVIGFTMQVTKPVRPSRSQADLIEAVKAAFS